MNPFFDTSLSVEERLDWLLHELTIEEKLQCMATSAPSIERLGIRGFSVGGEAAHGVEARNDQNNLGAAEETTSFVQPIGMSATWDAELIRQAGEVTGVEARVIYHRHPDRGLSRWAPTVDLERDPRWGRTEEGYGEDPCLTGAMASAYIQGMQGDDPDHLRVAATLKHFYANNTEAGRGWKSAVIDPRNRMELYLEPFRRCIEEGGAEAVMTAYNKINGTPGMLNPQVRAILKEQYGLRHAVCDGGAMEMVKKLHHYFGTHAETLAAAVKAGVDAMSDNPAVVRKAAQEAWERGLLSEQEIDGAIRNMFRTKLRLGIYDSEPVNPYDQATEADLCCERHREVSRQMAREAVVLLKNQDHMLPLDAADCGRTALIGPYADAWYQDWYGGIPPYRTTLADGVKNLTQTQPLLADGDDRVLFWHGEKGLEIADDGTLTLGAQPDVFVKQDWGEGNYTFYSVRTGKYLNQLMQPDQDGASFQIRANSDSPFDWFVTELFHIQDAGDGQIVLISRMDLPLAFGADGVLTAQAKEGCAFRMEVAEDGVKAACSLAEKCDTVILALGCCSTINAKEEIDRGTLALPFAQENLLKQVYKANPNLVLVLFSNYPYTICWAQDHVPAILWSATGSQDMGEAMAETIFGRSAPAGRLNLTWYQSDEQLPDIDDYDIIKGERTYRYFTGDVLYPFGHGLTYTSFSYADLKAHLSGQDKIRVSLSVANEGAAAGDEVVQIYGRAPASRVKKPRIQLLGFTRLKDVRPGEIRNVELEIAVSEFRFYDTISRTLMVEEGEYQIFAGRSSADLCLQAALQIPGGHTGERQLAEEQPADHYDDYENIVLTEGHFGMTAAAPSEREKDGILCYRDCRLPKQARAFCCHVKSACGARLEFFINGEKAGAWEGDTRTYEEEPGFAIDRRVAAEREQMKETWQPVYTDVLVPLPEAFSAPEEAICLQIRLRGDIRLCWFQAE